MSLNPEQQDSLPQESAPWPSVATSAHRDYPQQDRRLRSPAAAVLLSGMPGLGQVYLGYYKEGFINIAVAASLCAILSTHGEELAPLLGTFLAFFWLYNMVDAGRKAVLMNQGSKRLEAPELPSGFGTVGFRGQVFGGLALVAGGALALAHLRFGFSLAWIGTWWPAGLVLVGVYLIGQAVAERKA